MSLPQAMAALKRGEVEAPAEDSLGALMDGPALLPPRPSKPEPDRKWLDDELADWAREKATMRATASST
jgi:hypothetical protein